VKDDWIDENNATFSLSVVNGKMKVEPCEETDVCLTIAELTTMVFTGKGPKVLQALFPERICISFDRY
ncbi:MAG: sterol carrier protein domain-containing protein, partial [Candidatus Izemoplasmatales bacterium]|nr:sterol carrier protein domain-containing protein [Candidatus Izemoplasmatales bacterium]